ncbi:TPA: hypothetical protein KNT26_003111 [Clostridioides difficile]|nr:hypothetical protein [Clostridioides difficile]
MNNFKNKFLNFDICLEKHYESMTILNQNTKMYTGKYMVFDKFDFWQLDILFDKKRDALNYIDKLIDVKTQQEYNFLKWCTQKNIKEGSKIEFEDGKQGIILGSEHADGNIKYVPLKKDGTKSKMRRILYKNIKFKILKY